MGRNGKKRTLSPVICILDIVYESANKAVPHSWERLNHAMQQALTIAVGSGFAFESEDMQWIAEHYNFGYWSGSCTEWIYALAVETGNLTAAKSYETWKKRGPFIADSVTPRSYGGGSAFPHGMSTRQQDRLAVGFSFPWKGTTARVTSFADDGSSVTACSYRTEPNGKYPREKIAKRFRITRDDILADRAERKAAGKAVQDTPTEGPAE